MWLTQAHWENAAEPLAAQGFSHTRAIDTFLAYLAGEPVELPRRAGEIMPPGEHPADRPHKGRPKL